MKDEHTESWYIGTYYRDDAQTKLDLAHSGVRWYILSQSGTNKSNLEVVAAVFIEAPQPMPDHLRLARPDEVIRLDEMRRQRFFSHLDGQNTSRVTNSAFQSIRDMPAFAAYLARKQNNQS